MNGTPTSPDPRRTVAEAYADGTFQRPVHVHYHREPPPPRRSGGGLLSLVTFGVVVGSALFFGGPKALAAFQEARGLGPQPAFAVASQTCEHETPGAIDDLSVGGLLKSAVGAIAADRTVLSEVRIRNSGVEGWGVVEVEMEQSKAPYTVTRRERLYLQAGEERTLSYSFPEYVAGAEVRCRVSARSPEVAGR
ncbi:hypothetical protein [Rubricoccus marinus]|uniref:Uncharacterized protein n=1 Tax=Rubricoccus marinus TaxID=716817 RepID=A0A259TXB0_9BACT|nr:hypothetical protein [Rubricoccus marinus]OZC02395.1 hypothetical protein BSZ36_05045 [Rubricoccus marinus]